MGNKSTGGDENQILKKGLHKGSHSQVPQLKSHFNLNKDSNGSLVKVGSIRSLAQGQDVIASVGDQETRNLKMIQKGNKSQVGSIDNTHGS